MELFILNINIVDILVKIINKFGYTGIFVTTAMEYACFPVSSEFLLPFIGYSVSKGEMHILTAILTSTLGGITGSLFCYFVGRFSANFIEKKLCKRFKSIRAGINNAKRYFNKYGGRSVFLGRVFPIVRTYISIPAGMVKMNLSKFILYSGIGALLWNTVLISLGYFLGENWNNTKIFISQYAGILKILMPVLLFLILIKILVPRCKKAQKR